MSFGLSSKSNHKGLTFIFFAFLVSIIALLGSLFFSEVMNFIPCSLCWYQRVFMYPLAFLFLMNILFPDDKIFKYTFPLVVIGLIISIYHNLLMFKIIPEKLSPCMAGIPCSVDYINWLGFITIPLLSFFSYTIIFILLIMYKREKNAK